MEDALQSIEEKLSANPSFYAGQRITVESKSGPIPDAASDSIRAVFARYGLTCSVLDRKSAAEKASALLTQTVLMDEAPYIMGLRGNKPIDEYDARSEATIFRGDVVPGRSLCFEGSALILGDVLSGGRVQAAGDIIVTGIAGGSIHAGWPHDRSSCIMAGGLTAGSYRIGDLKIELEEAIGSQVIMHSIESGPEGLTVRAGDAGFLARKGGGN
jgi:septum formation inhibitor MinC